jgi:thiol-disulfide isomerase/thioredoxin
MTATASRASSARLAKGVHGTGEIDMSPIKKKCTALLTSIIVLLFFEAVFSTEPAQVGMPAPGISGQTWLNSEPLRIAELKGKVALVEFWTFGCYNCRNVEPYVKGWHQKYADKGLVVIGVHAPEFNYERVLANVQRYVREHAIKYPIAIDNKFTTWKDYGNRYWPAMYLIDKRGVVRYLRVGEGGYEQTERQIQALLQEPSGL